MKVEALKRAAVAAALCLVPCTAHPADKTIRGLKVGMSVPQALQSLDGEFRAAAMVRSILDNPKLARLKSTIDPGDPFLNTYELVAGDEE